MTADSGSSAYFRENSRAPVTAPASIQIDAFSDPLSAQTANVSMGGMFIEMDDHPPVGSIVRFQVEMGFPAGTVKGTAEVVWMRAAKQGTDQPAGIGLQFRFVEEDGEPLLREVVKQALEELGPEPEPQRKAPPPKPRRPPVLDKEIHLGGPGTRKEGESQAGRNESTSKGKQTADNEALMLRMPAEKAKMLILLILVAFLLLYLVL